MKIRSSIWPCAVHSKMSCRSWRPVDRSRTVLVVGLGNRNITADALGPKTVEQMLVTRHLFEHMPEVVGTDTASVCAIAPGVLGITGIETMEIVKGVAEHVKPGLIIVIDALAARKVERINTTIQISDTGISPGSGVGNNRKELSRATLGADVIEIGVPTVVDAVTMANDTLDITLSTIRAQAGEGAWQFCSCLSSFRRRKNTVSCKRRSRRRLGIWC